MTTTRRTVDYRIDRVPRHRVRLSGFDGMAQLVAVGVGAAVIRVDRGLRAIKVFTCLGAVEQKIENTFQVILQT